MRAKLWSVLLRGAVGLVGIAGIAGCSPEKACQEEGLLQCFSEGSGEDGGPPALSPDCIPSVNHEPVNDTCGIFVSASLGDDSNKGTKAKPVKKLSKALELARAASLPVYACAEPMVEEPGGLIEIWGGQCIFGRLNCAAEAQDQWVWISADPDAGAPLKTTISAPANEVPVRLKKGMGTAELHDLHILAKAATTPGESSIAVIANQATVHFVRSFIEAQNGAKGEDGTPYSSATATAGENGMKGQNACTMQAQIPGGVGPTNNCSSVSSSGGHGGNGSLNNGGNGTSGLPEDSFANYGNGESGLNVCTDGGDGKLGATGAAGADGSGLGTLDPKKGFIGVYGQIGGAGSPGQGGGGGGGSKSAANSKNQCPNGPYGGASGGSGGAGGCGGTGGIGGQFGGSSIAIVSLDSKLTFEDSFVIAGNGAEPGLGNNGQAGGFGGMGGPGGMGNGVIKAACKGGQGGNGGSGGKGGNGVGGHSISIAYMASTVMPEPSGVTLKIGSKGTGGVASTLQKFE